MRRDSYTTPNHCARLSQFQMRRGHVGRGLPSHVIWLVHYIFLSRRFRGSLRQPHACCNHCTAAASCSIRPYWQRYPRVRHDVYNLPGSLDFLRSLVVCGNDLSSTVATALTPVSPSGIVQNDDRGSAATLQLHTIDKDITRAV